MPADDRPPARRAARARRRDRRAARRVERPQRIAELTATPGSGYSRESDQGRSEGAVMRGRRVGSLLAAAVLLGTIGVGTAHAAPPATAADDAGTQAMTTQATVDRAKAIAKDACDKAAASQAAAQADPNNVAKQTQAAQDAAACAAAQANADNEQASLAGVNRGIPTEPTTPTLPADAHNPANGAVKSDNIEWLSNSRGLSSSVANPNGTTGNY